jgi:acid phosphatase
MDAWLRRNIEPYRRWAMSHNSLLIITWDEDEDDYTPVNDANGKRVAKRYLNHIPTIMAGQGVIAGTYDEYIDLYSIYPAHARTRKSAGSMTRKLSVTWSQ